MTLAPNLQEEAEMADGVLIVELTDEEKQLGQRLVDAWRYLKSQGYITVGPKNYRI